MAPSVSGPTGPSRDPEYSNQSGDDSVATVQVGEDNLSQVAQRLGVDLSSLLRANPQISDPSMIQAGQDIQFRRSEGQASTQDWKRGSDSAPQSNLPSAPWSDPLAKSVLQGKLDDSFRSNVMYADSGNAGSAGVTSAKGPGPTAPKASGASAPVSGPRIEVISQLNQELKAATTTPSIEMLKKATTEFDKATAKFDGATKNLSDAKKRFDEAEKRANTSGKDADRQQMNTARQTLTKAQQELDTARQAKDKAAQDLDAASKGVPEAERSAVDDILKKIVAAYGIGQVGVTGLEFNPRLSDLQAATIGTSPPRTFITLGLSALDSAPQAASTILHESNHVRRNKELADLGINRDGFNEKAESIYSALTEIEGYQLEINNAGKLGTSADYAKGAEGLKKHYLDELKAAGAGQDLIDMAEKAKTPQQFDAVQKKFRHDVLKQ